MENTLLYRRVRTLAFSRNNWVRFLHKPKPDFLVGADGLRDRAFRRAKRSFFLSSASHMLAAVAWRLRQVVRFLLPILRGGALCANRHGAAALSGGSYLEVLLTFLFWPCKSVCACPSFCLPVCLCLSVSASAPFFLSLVFFFSLSLSLSLSCFLFLSLLAWSYGHVFSAWWVCPSLLSSGATWLRYSLVLRWNLGLRRPS